MDKKIPMQPVGNIELYNKAVELHEKAYRKTDWNKYKYRDKVGFMLRHLFGKPVWTLKDLNDEQLKIVIDFSIKKIEEK